MNKKDRFFYDERDRQIHKQVTDFYKWVLFPNHDEVDLSLSSPEVWIAFFFDKTYYLRVSVRLGKGVMFQLVNAARAVQSDWAIHIPVQADFSFIRGCQQPTFRPYLTWRSIGNSEESLAVTKPQRKEDDKNWFGARGYLKDFHISSSEVIIKKGTDAMPYATRIAATASDKGETVRYESSAFSLLEW